MEPLTKENQFAKISIENDVITSTTKSWFLKLGYYWQVLPSGLFTLNLSPKDVTHTLLVREIKKMSIRGSAIAGYALLFIGVFIFLLQLIVYSNATDNEATGSSGGRVALIIIAAIFFLLGVLFLLSKISKVKTLYTTYGGETVIIYASPDMSEIKALQEAIENNKQQFTAPSPL